LAAQEPECDIRHLHSMTSSAAEWPSLSRTARPTISSRDKILECSHSLVDAAADTAIDWRLCVLIEEFNQE
jgi:hypothetical protein